MAYKPKVLAVPDGGTGLSSPSTSGNVLTSNGTIWVSSPPTMLFTQINISSANFKNSNTTPIQILPAAGSGNVWVIFRAIFKLNYGGSNAFTGSGTPAVQYTTAGVSAFSFNASAYTGTTNKAYSLGTIASDNALTLENDSIQCITISSNPAGNAAGDNTVSVGIWYTSATIV